MRNKIVVGFALLLTVIPVLAQGSVAAGSKVYVAPMDGNLNSYISAEIMKQKLPLVVVTDETIADYTISGQATVNTSTDVNGAVTTNSYAGSSCGNSFPTSVSEPLGLSRSMTWNCAGGVQLTATDENSKTLTTTYNDAYFWRAYGITDQASNTTNFGYGVGGKYVTPYMYFNNNSSISAVASNFDGLGRPSFDQRYPSPTAQSYETTSYTYDANGRQYSTSVPCSVGAGLNCPPATPKTTQTYDALNRPLVTTDGGNGTTTYVYNQNDVLVTIGSPAKSRQLEFDALGRLTSVCEITNATGSSACGQNVAQNGFLTLYSYDALNNLTDVAQNARGSQQTRHYSYDAMSRLTSEANPESGTTSYSYDSATGTTCALTSPGNMIKKVDANGNWTCYNYDLLHRLTDVGNNIQNAANACKRFRYDNWPGLPGSTKPSGLTNTLGRLAEVETDSGSLITDEWFSYTARGEVSDVYASTPHSGGYYHSALTYWANGAPNVLTGAGGYYAAYNVDGEGRPYQVSPASGQGMVTNTSYNAASLPTAITYGSGDSDSFTYDPNTNRMTQYKFTVGTSPQSLVGNLTWNANGTLQTQNITDPFNAANTQNCSYAYDDFTRLTSANCGTAAAQTFSYVADGSGAFGNITKSGTPFTFTPTYSPTTNRMTSIGSFTPTYDANGNVLNDNSHTYSWDVYGRPVTIDSVNLTYDALGRMVEQNRSGTYTQFTYAPTGEKMQIMNGQAPPTKEFVSLPGGGQAVFTTSGTYYYHADHLGSFRFGSTLSRAMYFDLAHAPFGDVYASSGSTDPAFTGQRQDTVAGLYDFPAREYNFQGRWPSPDPAGLAAVDPANPQSWNRYAYVLNDPLDYVDPFGLTNCPQGKTCGDPNPNDPGFIWEGDDALFGRMLLGAQGVISIFDVLDLINNHPDYCIPRNNCADLLSLVGGGRGGGTSGGTSGSTTTMGAAQGYKKSYCSHQGDLAAVEDLLPGITRGDYVSTAVQISKDTGAHLALEGAAASSVLKRAIRTRTGIAMSTAGKLFERATILLLFVSGEEALRAAQNEYQACMNY